MSGASNRRPEQPATGPDFFNVKASVRSSNRESDVNEERTVGSHKPPVMVGATDDFSGRRNEDENFLGKRKKKKPKNVFSDSEEDASRHRDETPMTKAMKDHD